MGIGGIIKAALAGSILTLGLLAIAADDGLEARRADQAALKEYGGLGVGALGRLGGA